MSWNDLSMADRAAYIKLGVENGITDLNTIRNAYNEFAKGGPIKNSKDYKKALSDYWHEDVNKYNKYDGGGPKENKVLSTGNSYADAALGFVPFVGSAMEIEDAIREPSLKNIGSAAFSVGTDLLGISLLRGGVKAYRLAKAANKAAKEFKAIASEKDVSKAYKILQTSNLSPKKYKAARETLRNSGANEAFRKAEDANNARIFYNLYERPFINNNLNSLGFTGSFAQDATQFVNSLDNNR